MATDSQWYVYVLQSQQPRFGKRGRLPGFFYVGCTTDPARRLNEHNGVGPTAKKGGKYTAAHRPWVPRALFGPYPDRSTAMSAEHTLKRSKRGTARVTWSPEDSPKCCGLGPNDPWVLEADHAAIIASAAPSAPRRPRRRRRRRRL